MKKYKHGENPVFSSGESFEIELTLPDAVWQS